MEYLKSVLQQKLAEEGKASNGKNEDDKGVVHE
jgi:hypothetical protein